MLEKGPIGENFGFLLNKTNRQTSKQMFFFSKFYLEEF